ncbi:MAG TPA: glycosyltransferase family 2 protein [Xanthobacteraceae bacterium]|nr:glycosyltransferase family 2 protein [Xanthobacteraceae bacterium]
MSDAPTVSVIIPTWNRAATVIPGIESALRQTCAPLEVLVCDDASTDDTEALVRQMADPRIRWLPGPRGGRPAIPRNRGMAAARGEWLAFLDSDDEWLPHKLQAQLQAVAKSGRLASCTNAWRIVAGVRQPAPLLDRPPPVLGLDTMLAGNIVVCSSALIHRSLVATVEGFPEPKLFTAIEDYAMWLRVSALTEFDCLAAPCVLYRDDPAGSLRAESIEGSRQRIEILIDFLAWCRRHPSLRSWRAEIAARRYRFKYKLWRENEVPRVERIRRRLADAWHGRR